MASSRDKIRVLANGDILPSATLDRFQERTLQSPFTVSSGSPANFDTAFATWNGTIATDGEQQGPGSYDRMGCSLYNGTGISNNNLVILDDTIDWRGRLLSIELLVTTDATTMPGGANAHLFGTSSLVALSATAVNSPLYTNGGATNSGTGNNPVAGSPPNTGPAGTTAGQFFRQLTSAAGLTLYVEGKTPYRLALYNSSGSTLYVAITKLRASGKDGRF